MLKFVGFLTVLAMAFLAGVYMGTEGPDVVFKKAREIGAEVAAKTILMQKDQTIRMRLLNAKERMVQAKSDLLDKNYGKAATSLEETIQTLSQTREAAGEDLRPRLDGLIKKLSDAAADAKALKPGVLGKLTAASKDLDELLGR